MLLSRKIVREPRFGRRLAGGGERKVRVGLAAHVALRGAKFLEGETRGPIILLVVSSDGDDGRVLKLRSDLGVVARPMTIPEVGLRLVELVVGSGTRPTPRGLSRPLLSADVALPAS